MHASTASKRARKSALGEIQTRGLSFASSTTKFIRRSQELTPQKSLKSTCCLSLRRQHGAARKRTAWKMQTIECSVGAQASDDG